MRSNNIIRHMKIHIIHTLENNVPMCRELLDEMLNKVVEPENHPTGRNVEPVPVQLSLPTADGEIFSIRRPAKNVWWRTSLWQFTWGSLPGVASRECQNTWSMPGAKEPIPTS